ncbi:MAG: hypothetical protein Q9187_008295 [Circinaria calcarea]
MERGKEEETSQSSQLPPSEIFRSALNIGALTGTSGFLIGGVTGILRSPNPGIFALASSLQWFALGSTFWASRAFILNTRLQPHQSLTSNDRLFASTLSGGFTGGTIGYLIRGRSSLIPGTILFSILGLLGQSAYNRFDARHTLSLASPEQQQKTMWHRIAEMKWSPMKVLSDEEYENMLRERLLRVDAEIAIVDEDLGMLREQEKNRKGVDGPTA